MFTLALKDPVSTQRDPRRVFAPWYVFDDYTPKTKHTSDFSKNAVKVLAADVLARLYEYSPSARQFLELMLDHTQKLSLFPVVEYDQKAKKYKIVSGPDFSVAVVKPDQDAFKAFSSFFTADSPLRPQLAQALFTNQSSKWLYALFISTLAANPGSRVRWDLISLSAMSFRENGEPLNVGLVNAKINGADYSDSDAWYTLVHGAVRDVDTDGFISESKGLIMWMARWFTGYSSKLRINDAQRNNLYSVLHSLPIWFQYLMALCYSDMTVGRNTSLPSSSSQVTWASGNDGNYTHLKIKDFYYWNIMIPAYNILGLGATDTISSWGESFTKRTSETTQWMSDLLKVDALNLLAVGSGKYNLQGISSRLADQYFGLMPDMQYLRNEGKEVAEASTLQTREQWSAPSMLSLKLR